MNKELKVKRRLKGKAFIGNRIEKKNVNYYLSRYKFFKELKYDLQKLVDRLKI